MTKILFYSVILILFCYCTSKKQNEVNNDVLVVKNQNYKKEVPNKLSQKHITNLPFGCSLLSKHKFPKDWWKTRDFTNPEDTIMKVHEKEIWEIWHCFDKINNKDSISSPITYEDNQYILGDYPKYLNPPDDSLLYFVKNFKYRLPDCGIYQCYYTFNLVNSSANPNILSKVGNLVLIDSAQKKTKVINLYMVIESEYSFYSRYFYIDENYRINIYEGEHYELESKVMKKYEINILINGEIEVISF